MSSEEIENRFVRAGWHLDGGFAGYLVIGYDQDGLSILARQEAWSADEEDPVFELIDHVRNLTYWVSEIPTPQQAQELLHEHGEPPEVWEA